MNKDSTEKPGNGHRTLKPAMSKVFRFLWKGISGNFPLKIISVLIAILLWNYVITTDTSITRSKTITGLTGYISGQSSLNTTYGLALAEDPSEKLNGISVVLQVSKSEYSRANADSIQVMLDLTGVRTAGTQSVSLKAITNYGHVQRIIPESLTLEFETIDSRSIPVNVELTDESENLWYNVTRSNPSVLTVKGAASVVQSITSAEVLLSAEDRSASFTQAAPFTLFDVEGNEVASSMLERSASSVSVSVDVYPMKSIPISTDLDSVVTGSPAEGLYVESVKMQPASLTVAAEQEILDEVSVLHVDPIDVSGAAQSFNTRTAVSALSSFKFVSASEVYAYVTLSEDDDAGSGMGADPEDGQ